ncbi:MAG: long-chain-fatty-acid--CoA ligase [Gammaproteobacteria bacterium]
MKELVYHQQFFPALRQYADRTVIADGTYSATFAEHADRVFRLGHGLRERLGVGKGERFAVMSMNSHEFIELYHAAFLGTGVINPLNLRLAGKELDYILRDSGTKVAFVDPTFAPLLAHARQLGGSDCPIERVVLIGAADATDTPYDLTYDELLQSAEPVEPEVPEESDPVVLMYTGGTTGLPKGVLVTQRAEMLNAYHVTMVMGRRSDDINLMQTPVFHAASMVGCLATMTSGSKLVTMPMFDPGGVLKLIEAHGVTQTTMVPTMVGMMLQHPDFKPEALKSLRQLTYGASPMPAALLDTLLKILPDLEIQQGYGMTECSSVLTMLTTADHLKGGPRLRSVGRSVPGVDLCVQDEEGNLLPPGEVGEVCARGGNFMEGYWKKPEATEEAFRDGWYHTGDAGYLDDEGYLFLVDRVKDMIVTGGENVYSAEVESAVSTHPAVAQVAVIGIPHDLWGEQVHAIVVPREGAEVTEDDIIAHAREAIAGYKAPKSVEFRAEPLPLSGAMKVLKRELREPYWKDQEKRIS